MATLLFFLFASACEADPCRVLCQETAAALGRCIPEWGVEWADLGAAGQARWTSQCQDDWDSVRANLEAREVPAAEDQCTDARDELADLEGCDTLQGLYLPAR